jgi:glutaredoxin 3
MKNVELYVWTSCPFCIQARRLLEAKGVSFTEHVLDGKDAELAALRQRTGQRTVPQIFIGEDFVGGYTELAGLERSGQLDQMLNT